MLECTICGLLSLNARSCPACGSQNLIDLASEDNDPSMPTEVPGLDDAVNSLHDLEGIDKVEQDSDAEFTQAKKSTSTSSLTFGFSGQSNVHLSRLPFGIGSQAEGVPFESEEEDKAEEMPVAVSNSVNKITPNPILVEQNKPIVEVPKVMTMVRV